MNVAIHIPFVRASHSRSIATLLSILILAALTLSACSDKEPKLAFLAQTPVTAPFIRYSATATDGELRDYVILREGEGTELVMVNMTVANISEDTIDLRIDQSAVELVLGNRSAIKPIDPIMRALQPLEDSDPAYTVEGFLPIWGEVSLPKGYELSGYFVFEVPAGSAPDKLRWKASEKTTVNFE